MDDHRWAFLAWETSARRRGAPRAHALLHADYHFDGINDFQTQESVDLLRAATIDELRALVEAERLIKYESFIAPAVIRGIVDRVHFVCRQDNTDRGLDEDLVTRYHCRQSFSDRIEVVPDDWPPDATIFDLCLDLFNESGDEFTKAPLWPDDEVIRFLDKASGLIRRASIVTVSLSFGYSGEPEQTRHLAELVLPRMLRLREAQ